MFRRITTSGTALLAGAVIVVLLGPASGSVRLAPHASAQRRALADVHVIAHRGASAYAPENTLAAVRVAADLGAEWVENDVQRTKDGRLVVIHDTTLRRTTDVEQRYPDRSPWRVGDFTLAEIARLDAGSWFGEAYRGERVPTLEQYLDLVSRTGQKLLLEIKAPELYPGIEEDTLKVLQDTGWLTADRLRDDLVIQSFSADSIATVHRLDPRVRTGFLGSPKPADLPAYARFSDQINPPRHSVTAQYMASIHSLKGPHGKPLRAWVWTIDDPAVAKEMVDAGVDGIISNQPDTVLGGMGRAAGAPPAPYALGGWAVNRVLSRH